MKRLDLSLGRRLVCLRIGLLSPRMLPCVIASLGRFTLMFNQRFSLRAFKAL